MPRVVIDIRKMVEANAADYYERAKKARKKLVGARVALEKTGQKLAQLMEKREFAQQQLFEKISEKKKADARRQDREWFEKFRWFISSEGFLCIGGRDATSNEIVIKKHTDSNDLVFHTEMAGSPFFVVKRNSNPGSSIGMKTLEEAAAATASYSRAWKAGLHSVEVYNVKPEQVSKEAQAGEYLSKGAFMIYGKKNYIPSRVELALGIDEKGRVMGGPFGAVSMHCSKSVKLVQGDLPPSDAAKKIIRILQIDSSYLDEVIRALPAGEFKIMM